MNRLFRVLSCLLVLGCASLRGEVYMGINYSDSLGQVRKLFPTAKITNAKPAWAKPEDALYSISGEGIAGTIVVKFNDTRPLFKMLADTSVPGTNREKYEKLASQSDDDALTVQWVRWAPDTAIPLKRLVEKYGPWDKKEIHIQSYQSQRTWTKRKISAHIADDDKSVQMIDFDFTPDEKIKGLRGNGEVVGPEDEKYYRDMDKPEPKPKKNKK